LRTRTARLQPAIATGGRDTPQINTSSSIISSVRFFVIFFNNNVLKLILDQVIQPCRVLLEPFAESRSKHAEATKARGEVFNPIKLERFVGEMRQSAICIYCSKTSRDKDGLQKHTNQMHSKVQIKCSIYGCSKYFLKKQDLDSHFLLQHKAKEDLKIFGCTQCKYKSSQKSELILHIVKRHGREQLPCPKCDNIYKSQQSLKIHLQGVHKKRPSCKFCYAVLVQVKRHMVRQQCKWCDFVAPCISLFWMHVQRCTAAAK
jgi:uncharacterized C2H2 Zn-finger protein